MRIANPIQVPSGLFVYTLRPTRVAMLTEGATEEERAHAARHWSYSIELLRDGKVIFGGRTLNRDSSAFAFLVFRAASLDEARAVAHSDPAVQGGVFSAEVFPFQPMLMGAWPEEAATVPAGA